MHQRIAQLAEFETFRKDLLPMVRDAIKDGLAPEEIYERFAPFAAARAVSIAASEPDSNKALAAIKEILDRAFGKAKERIDVSHKMARLPDAELDALLMSSLRDVEDIEIETPSTKDQDESELPPPASDTTDDGPGPDDAA